MRLTTLLSAEEYMKLNEDALSRGFYRDDPRIFTPGMGWLNPWHYDPTGERERAGLHVMHKHADRGKTHFLSVHYWNDWSDIRAPIIVVCPNGEQWEIDRKSSNGNGWVVIGEWPYITCTPSIVVPGYHGFLKDGEFTPDLENRGLYGVMREVVSQEPLSDKPPIAEDPDKKDPFP